MEHSGRDTLTRLPQIETLLQSEELRPWIPRLSRPLVARLAAAAVDLARERIRAGEPFEGTEAVLRNVLDRCREAGTRRIHRVINATGVVLHTNMGRAPLSAAAWRAAAAVNTGYSNLELDLSTGKRGKRNGLVPDLLSLLVGSEGALMVNNNAAAVFLILSCLAADRQVIVSRGEQVQIGGGFRIPEILAHAGAHMVEVGTTNITRLDDYTAALRPETSLVLIVHSSNFRLRGFTSRPSVRDLAAALPEGVLVVVDQGSGTTTERIPGETMVSRYLDSGAHLVSFSGDKVLGGPQAGLIAGRGDLIRTLSRHPLNRVFRPGKTIYSLMERTLVARLNGAEDTPVQAALKLSMEELRQRGETVLAGLPGAVLRLVDSTVTTGGGSAPDEHFPSLSIAVEAAVNPQSVLAALRDRDPPIIGTIGDGGVRLNLATLLPGDIETVREALGSILDEPAATNGPVSKKGGER